MNISLEEMNISLVKWILIVPVIILIDILLYIGGIFSAKIRVCYMLSACVKSKLVEKYEQQ